MLLNNCRLLADFTGGVQSESGHVRLTEDGRIGALGPRPARPEAGEAVYDCGGRTLLPGLMDIHTHVCGLTDLDPAKLADPIAFFLDRAGCLGRYLDSGYTTIRDAGAPLHMARYLGMAVDRGLAEGPRILSCGPILGPQDAPAADALTNAFHRNLSGPEEFRRAAREVLAEGEDFLKCYASGSALCKTGIPRQPIMLEEELRACVEIARMKETYVAAHAHSAGSVLNCIRAGVRTIEHGSFLDGECVRLLLDTPGVYLVPTLSAMYQNEEKTRGTPFEYLIDKLREMLRLSAGCLAGAYGAGVRKLGFGTDCGPGSEQHENGIEFRFRKEYMGMSNLDILLQATVYNAEILGIEQETGSIRPGLCADLILIDGRPDQDLSVMYRRPFAVWARGRKAR